MAKPRKPSSKKRSIKQQEARRRNRNRRRAAQRLTKRVALVEIDSPPPPEIIQDPSSSNSSSDDRSDSSCCSCASCIRDCLLCQKKLSNETSEDPPSQPVPREPRTLPIRIPPSTSKTVPTLDEIVSRKPTRPDRTLRSRLNPLQESQKIKPLRVIHTTVTQPPRLEELTRTALETTSKAGFYVTNSPPRDRARSRERALRGLRPPPCIPPERPYTGPPARP